MVVLSVRDPRNRVEESDCVVMILKFVVFSD